MNDPLYNHPVFGPARGRGGDFGGKPEDQLVAELLEVRRNNQLKKKIFIQLLAHLRCTVLTPGWEKRRVLLSDLKSRQPTTWEADHQTTFHLQTLVLSLPKICKAAGWMLTAMSAQSGGLIGIPDQQH